MNDKINELVITRRSRGALLLSERGMEVSNLGSQADKCFWGLQGSRKRRWRSTQPEQTFLIDGLVIIIQLGLYGTCGH